MRDGAKFSYLIAFAFIGMWICKRFQPHKKSDELIVNGIAIPRSTYVSVLNDLYGPGVDSNAACDCLISAFYEFIKDNPVATEKFKEEGIYPLPDSVNDSFRPIYKDCLRRNMLDSTYILHWTGKNKESFRRALRADILATPNLADHNPDSLSGCLVQQFNNHITIAEYLEPVYFVDDRLRPLILNCIGPIK